MIIGKKTGEATCSTEAFEQPEIRNEMPPERRRLVWRNNSHKRRMDADESETPEQSIPTQGKVKWVETRSSNRVSKEPKWQGHNVMVTKNEHDFSLEGASLTSVNKIPNPKNIL